MYSQLETHLCPTLHGFKLLFHFLLSMVTPSLTVSGAASGLHSYGAVLSSEHVKGQKYFNMVILHRINGSVQQAGV